MKLHTTLGQLRLLAILEGVSYLLLIPTMILKYGFEIGFPNKIVGSAHGVLFIMYCLWVIYFAINRKWNLTKTVLALVASLVPVATFIVDKKYLQNESEDDPINVRSGVLS